MASINTQAAIERKQHFIENFTPLHKKNISFSIGVPVDQQIRFAYSFGLL